MADKPPANYGFDGYIEERGARLVSDEEKLRDELGWVKDQILDAAEQQRDEALARIAELESERDRTKPELAAFLLDETAVHRDRLIEEAEGLRDRIAELESRRPMVCVTCLARHLQRMDTGYRGPIKFGCPLCGKDGCGPGVRWETTR